MQKESKKKQYQDEFVEFRRDDAAFIIE